MINKLSSFMAIGLLVATVTPALAFSRMNLDINARLAKVTTKTEATSVSGDNTAVNSVDISKAKADDVKLTWSSNDIHTGASYTGATSTTLVNKGSLCNTCRSSDINVDAAWVKSTTSSMAISGQNTAANTISVEKAHVDDITLSGSNHITTGASSAHSTSLTVVNSTWSM